MEAIVRIQSVWYHCWMTTSKWPKATAILEHMSQSPTMQIYITDTELARIYHLALIDACLATEMQTAFYLLEITLVI